MFQKLNFLIFDLFILNFECIHVFIRPKQIYFKKILTSYARSFSIVKAFWKITEKHKKWAMTERQTYVHM